MYSCGLPGLKSMLHYTVFLKCYCIPGEKEMAIRSDCSSMAWNFNLITGNCMIK